MQNSKLRPRHSRLDQGYMGFILILPWLIGFVIFKAYPFISSLYYSFTDWNLFRGGSWIGIENYVQAFTATKNLRALKVTFIYAFMTVPLKLMFALFIAYILNFKIKGVGLVRTAYYSPSILGGSMAIAVLWRALFKNDGVINRLLTILGLQNINFLADKTWALFIICLLRVWQFGSPMVLFLAALKGVPEELYEAASIDGASGWQKLFFVTIPSLRNTIFVTTMLRIIWVANSVDVIFNMTEGGPAFATQTLSVYIYKKANALDMGYASAMAIMLMLVLLVAAIPYLRNTFRDQEG